MWQSPAAVTISATAPSNTAQTRPSRPQSGLSAWCFASMVWSFGNARGRSGLKLREACAGTYPANARRHPLNAGCAMDRRSLDRQQQAEGRARRGGIDPRLALHLVRARMLQHVAEGLLQDAQHVHHILRREAGKPRDLAHLPVQVDALLLEALVEAVAQVPEYRQQVVLRRLERVDGEAQVVEAFAQRRGHLGLRELSLLDQAQRRDELPAHAVVHVAHDALALRVHGALRL